MEEKGKYETGPAGLFHGHATKTPAPLWCSICCALSMVYVEDDGRFEIYHCTNCGMYQNVAVR